MNGQEQIKANVSKILSLRNIKRFVYVDEEFGSQLYQDKYIDYIRKCWDKNGFHLPFEYFKDAGVEAIISDFFHWWNSSEEMERMESIKSLHITIGNAFKIKTALESIFGNTVIQEYIHPYVFQDNCNKGLYDDTSAKNQILVFMDFDLKGVEHDGLYYLRHFINKNHIQCGLFSQTFSIDGEIANWNTICNRSPYIYPLSKERITNNPGKDFIEGLRNVLWLRQISELKKKYSLVMKQATKSLDGFMNSIDPATFNKIVMTKSEDEGCWEFDTLNRLGAVRISKEIENILVNGGFQSFQGKFNVLRELRSKTIDHITADTQLAKDLNQLGRYEDDKYINFIYSQISNGDIFRINSNDYILLCQPCNLEIRTKGKRNAGELLYIIPLTKQERSIDDARIKLKDFQKEKKMFLSTNQNDKLINRIKDFDFDDLIPQNKDIVGPNISSLKYKNDIYLLRYNEAILVDAIVLDLVSFNKGGKASLTIDKRAFNKYVEPNMKERFFKMMGFIKKDNPNLEDYKPYGFNGTRIADLDITRISRLKDPWAQEYLQEFMAYLSRPAYPMDLE